MLISVSTGCRPICLPTIRGSMMLRMMVMMTYTTSRARARPMSPPRAVRMAQGIMMPPVPSTGRMSKMAISRATSSARSTPTMLSPTDSSTKVMDMIRA